MFKNCRARFLTIENLQCFKFSPGSEHDFEAFWYLLFWVCEFSYFFFKYLIPNFNILNIFQINNNNISEKEKGFVNGKIGKKTQKSDQLCNKGGGENKNNAEKEVWGREKVGEKRKKNSKKKLRGKKEGQVICFRNHQRNNVL